MIDYWTEDLGKARVFLGAMIKLIFFTLRTVITTFEY